MANFVTFPETFTGDTWDGFTFVVSDAAEDTDYAGALTLARCQLQDYTGASALSLSSAVSGQVTINVSSAYLWSVTVEPRILTLSAGTYSVGLELTDNSTSPPRIKTRLTGTLQVCSDPVL
jgi:hypothetical protein